MTKPEAAGATTQARQAVEGQAWLIVLSGGSAGRRHSIERSAVLGRYGEASVVLDDPEVSRRHARIARTPMGFVLEDLDSHNGTFLNGVPVDGAAVLNFGDRIQIGSHVLMFTHYDRAEQELLQRQRLETLGRLSAGVAHDFNNMLSVVTASLDYLERQDQSGKLGDPGTRECLQDIRTATRRAADLTPRLLTFARGEASGRHRLVDVSELCDTTLTLIRRTFERRVEIHDDIHADLFVMGDGVELHHVLMNLCLNARDAMLDGGVLNLRARPVTAAKAAALSLPATGPHVAVIVQDTGAGFDDETRKRIFEPFFTTKRGGRGFGLGLAAVHEIVTVHGGRIGVKSQPGKGSTFAVYLPAAGPADTVIPKAKKKKEEQTTKPGVVRSSTIMLVDDEAVVRRSLRRILALSGHEVLEAADGNEAVELFTRNPGAIDLVIVDLDMPQLDGEQTQRLLRGIDPSVRVLGLTGRRDEERFQAMRDGGALGMLEKPCNAGPLLDAIGAALRTPRQTPPVVTDENPLPRRQAHTQRRE